MISRRLVPPLAIAALALASGCLERTVTVTSDPPGAVVQLNDVEIGRTPVTTAFTWYGTYDVQVRKAGYEPLNTFAPIYAPIYEYPPLDLAAIALPITIQTERKLHFNLEPLQPIEGPAEAALIERARAMRSELPEQQTE